MSPSDVARLGADARKIALLEKLRNRALRGTRALREAVAALTGPEMDLLHDFDIEKLNADAAQADNRMEFATR